MLYVCIYIYICVRCYVPSYQFVTYQSNSAVVDISLRSSSTNRVTISNVQNARSFERQRRPDQAISRRTSQRRTGIIRLSWTNADLVHHIAAQIPTFTW